ncbi:hypothetical protein OAV86_05165 [Pseudomonadales bacterium]|nr:hypothetical protein [Pseudomonadales bacterium]
MERLVKNYFDNAVDYTESAPVDFGILEPRHLRSSLNLNLITDHPSKPIEVKKVSKPFDEMDDTKWNNELLVKFKRQNIQMLRRFQGVGIAVAPHPVDNFICYWQVPSTTFN